MVLESEVIVLLLQLERPRHRPGRKCRPAGGPSRSGRSLPWSNKSLRKPLCRNGPRRGAWTGWPGRPSYAGAGWCGRNRRWSARVWRRTLATPPPARRNRPAGVLPSATAACWTFCPCSSRPGQEKRLLPQAAPRPGNHVGDDLFVGMAEVRLAVDVVNGGCDVKSLAHLPPTVKERRPLGKNPHCGGRGCS